MDALDYYAAAGRFTSLADDEFSSTDIARVADVVQGLLVYDTVAADFYGAELTDLQAGAIHERDAAKLLDIVRRVDARPLIEARPPALRVGGRCRSYSLLTVAFLRSAGVPARARCGFGTTFNPGWYEDHWVVEYWSAPDAAWLMADTQMDETWRRVIALDGDPLRLDPSAFVTAGHAWQAWRAGDLDADRCGLSSIDEHGAFWIAGNLRLDFAALNKVEMHPWDLWGAGWEPAQKPTEELLALFDEVAAFTVDPDTNLSAIIDRYQTDDALRMDGTVFNVLLGCEETVA